LLREIRESSYVAIGRKYGVSDNAVRKWIRFHERERERLEREFKHPYPLEREPG